MVNTVPLATCNNSRLALTPTATLSSSNSRNSRSTISSLQGISKRKTMTGSSPTCLTSKASTHHLRNLSVSRREYVPPPDPQYYDQMLPSREEERKAVEAFMLEQQFLYAMLQVSYHLRFYRIFRTRAPTPSTGNSSSRGTSGTRTQGKSRCSVGTFRQNP